MDLRSLHDKVLLESTLQLALDERNLVTQVLHHLREIERRKLYSSLGYPSLFEYAVDRLGYSEAEAYRRIAAMRVMSEIPEVEGKIASGEISLTNIALAQTVFRREFKLHGKKIPKEDKAELLRKLERKTTREAEKAVMKLTSSPVSLMNDRIRPVGDDVVEIRFAGSKELGQKIAQLRGLLAHKEPDLSLGELFEKLCDLAIENWSPQFAAPKKRCAKVNLHKTHSRNRINGTHDVKSKRPDKMISSRSAVPAEIRRQVWRRDQGRCKKCGSLYKLEVDHIYPVALGGTNSIENLRLLCRPCNQRGAIEVFGIDKVETFIRIDTS